jgi:hypothetical protein
MKIEIELSQSVIMESAMRAWKDTFRSPQYQNQPGGEGYEQIRENVKKHLYGLEMGELIRSAVHETAASLTEPIVREYVTEELRKRVKQVVKEEMKGQTLFGPEAK